MSLPNIAALVQQAANQGVNYNETTKGGAYTPPAAGVAIVTLVSYIELGMHASSYQGKPKPPAPKAVFVFELRSKNHSVAVGDDGKVKVERIGIEVTLSRHEKAKFVKLFKQLNYDQSATHPAQLVGKHWLGRVVHGKSADGSRTFANLEDEAGFTFSPPLRAGDPTTGEASLPIAKPETLSPLAVFLWDYADQAQWDSIFIDGEYEKDDGTKVSRNRWQDKIKTATNFAGSPIEQLLSSAAMDLSDAGVVSTPSVAQDDPLAGVL